MAIEELRTPDRESGGSRMLWAEFLESAPPNSERTIEDLFVKTKHWTELRKSEIRIHCWSETCSDVRIFYASVTPSENHGELSTGWLDGKITYVCRHCRESYKYFSVRCWKDHGDAMSGRGSEPIELLPLAGHRVGGEPALDAVDRPAVLEDPVLRMQGATDPCKLPRPRQDVPSR